MPLANPFLPQPDETEELVIERHPREPSVWTIHHRETRLIVGAAPWSKAPALLKRKAFHQPSCYAILGDSCILLGSHGLPGAHVGRTGRPPVRARQHRNAPPLAAMRRLVIITVDDGRGLLLDEAAALEQALHAAARAAGSHRIVSRPPHDRGVPAAVLTRVNRWLGVLHWMFAIARCDILEPRPADIGAAENPADAVLPVREPPSVGWTTELPRDLLRRPDAQRFRLEHDGVTASALMVGGWCVVERGSRGRAGEIPSIQQGLQNKRRALRDAGILRPVPGRGDLWEAAHSIGLPSLTNAARVLLGNNAGRRLWRRIG